MTKLETKTSPLAEAIFRLETRGAMLSGVGELEAWVLGE